MKKDKVIEAVNPYYEASPGTVFCLLFTVEVLNRLVVELLNRLVVELLNR